MIHAHTSKLNTLNGGKHLFACVCVCVNERRGRGDYIHIHKYRRGNYIHNETTGARGTERARIKLTIIAKRLEKHAATSTKAFKLPHLRRPAKGAVASSGGRGRRAC